jgi:hypothetical protein
VKTLNLRSPLRAVAANPPIGTFPTVFLTPIAAFAILALALLVAGADPQTAFAQTVGYTGSAAVNFGAVNVCPSGKATPAPCSTALTLTYKVNAGGTLGTPLALTAGAPNLDYKVASGTTCSGSVTQGNTCKVNIAFAPSSLGARNGAVEIVDRSGKVLATTYIYGTGVGPAIGFNPPAQVALGGANFPYTGGAFAADGSGDLFIVAPGAQGQNGAIEELLAVNGALPAKPTVKVLAQVQGYFASVASIAVDGAGNVFLGVSQYYERGYVEELLAAGGYANSQFLGGTSVASTASFSPASLAVDGSGNVFVSSSYFLDDQGYWAGGLYEITAAGGYATLKMLGGGFQSLPYFGIALDANGNLFAANGALNTYGPGYVIELNPGNNYSTVKLLGVNYESSAPEAIAVDPAGDLFAVFAVSNSLMEYLAVNGVLPASPASRTYGQYNQPYELAFDGRGNLLVADDAGLHQLQLSAPSSTPLDFAQTMLGQTSADSPQSVQIQNQGNAALALAGLALDSSNWALVKDGGSPQDCSVGLSLVSSALCNISVSFQPTEAGPLTGAVELADNSLNASGAQQSILLEGFGDSVAPPYIASLNTSYAAPYSVVLINGTNFGAKQVSGIVAFNGVDAPVCRWSNTQIEVTVPASATTGSLVVTVGGEISNSVRFTIAPVPVVTGISPTSGPVGTVVTISGKNLYDDEDLETVSLNGKSLPVIIDTGTAIKVAVPAGAATGSFHVLVNDTGLNTPAFTVTK